MSVAMRKPARPSSVAGFTLVEMAIVLAIIGLLTGGILKASELYRLAQTRRLFSDINSISAAIKGFQEKYGSLPGDFPLATKHLTMCDASTHCEDGNGDSAIGRHGGGWGGGSGWTGDQAGTSAKAPYWYGETTQFWKHLALGGFIRGVNIYADPANPEWYQTHPGTPNGGGFTIFTDTQTAGSAITIRYQNTVFYGTVGGQNAVDPHNQRPFTVMQAMYLDQKYDDGKAAAGYIWGIPYSGMDDPPCRTNASGGAYNVAVGDTYQCQQHFILH